MITLGIDTATSATAVALRRDGAVLGERRDDPAAGAHPGHATRLLPMAAELLASEGVRWAQVTRIAVGVGPGTFTGLRVGVATARGLAQSLAAELVGVSSLQALALPALADGDPLLALIDARRGEVFAAVYAAAPEGPPRELLAPRALAPGLLAGLVESLPAARRWLAVGDGAVRYSVELAPAGIATLPADSPLQRVSAAAICALGESAAVCSPVVPDYRRVPDAELALEGVGASGTGSR